MRQLNREMSIILDNSEVIQFLYSSVNQAVKCNLQHKMSQIKKEVNNSPKPENIREQDKKFTIVQM